MFRRTAIVTALAAGALLVPFATPARAAERAVELTCSTSSRGPSASPTIWATAYYEPVSGGRRQWTRFEYVLGGTRVGSWGNDNNVNIRVLERLSEERVVNGEPVFVFWDAVRLSYDSPDNRRWGTTYTFEPRTPVYTSATDVLPNDRITVEAVFDRTTIGPINRDPRCTARSPEL